ncbi:MAG TPA: NAD(P)H-dependent glycerol-3-phosphate dehydrogenase [Methylophilaceae bacterium]|jgi:glycerol-3-phosphate dehydrogenase (NAD(P)+)
MKVAVLGAGAWGTALAIQIAREHQVLLWTRNQDHLQEMRQTRMNRRYLGDFPFADSLQIESDFNTAIRDADIILAAVPTNGLRETLRNIRLVGGNKPVVWACKGLEASSAKLLYEVAQEELAADAPWGILSGPSFAEEVAQGSPTAITVASSDENLAHDFATALHGGNLRVYHTTDVIGVAVGGALKNVIAIASGISDGMGFGLNARAALLTRGLAEITRFGVALGGKAETLMGLAGAGDLILTATGNLSRNYKVGLHLAKGETLEQILAALGHVAEGVSTAREVGRRAATMGVEMPITNQVNRVISEGLSPRTAVENLLGREQKPEN